MNQDISATIEDDVTPSSKAVAREDRIDPGLPPEGTPINQFEVRGYEMAKLQPDGSWRSVYHVNGSELARRRIITDAKWFNSRGTGTYQARVLVSAEMPREADIDPLTAPLLLNEDEGDIPQEVIEAMINDVELEAAERPTSVGTDEASPTETGDSTEAPDDETYDAPTPTKALVDLFRQSDSTPSSD